MTSEIFPATTAPVPEVYNDDQGDLTVTPHKIDTVESPIRQYHGRFLYHFHEEGDRHVSGMISQEVIQRGGKVVISLQQITWITPFCPKKLPYRSTETGHLYTKRL